MIRLDAGKTSQRSGQRGSRETAVYAATDREYSWGLVVNQSARAHRSRWSSELKRNRETTLTSR